jgi:hypothetical protein
MTRISLLTLALVPALALATSARGAGSKSSPWIQALSNDFVVVDMAEGDLDGDGSKDTVVCYQDDADSSAAGGVAILRKTKGQLRPGYHVRLEQAWCEQVQIRGNKVGFLLKSRTLDKKRGQLVWTYGKDFHFVGDGKHFVDRARVDASSSAGGSLTASAAVDGTIASSWAEGAKGTGIGETLTIKLRQPMDIAYVAIYGGHGSKRGFFDNNRVHRGSLSTRTAEDLGDSLAGIDFSELGIGGGGDRIEFSFENRPGVHYVRVDRRRVQEIELRIESVYLGRKSDDTHVAEIEVVPLLTLSETLDRAKPVSVKRKKKKKLDDDEDIKRIRKEQQSKTKKALEKLDAEGRGLEIPDDF